MINLPWNPARFMSIVLLRTRTNERYTELCSVVWCRTDLRKLQHTHTHTRARKYYVSACAWHGERAKNVCCVLFVWKTVVQIRGKNHINGGNGTESESHYYLFGSSVYTAHTALSLCTVCTVSVLGILHGIWRKSVWHWRMLQKLTCPIGKSMSSCAPYTTRMLYRMSVGNVFSCGKKRKHGRIPCASMFQKKNF